MARREGTRSSGRPDGRDDGRSPTRIFHLLRLADESGVSGTGRVAEGVIFSNGWVALVWLTDIAGLTRTQALKIMRFSAQTLLDAASR